MKQNRTLVFILITLISCGGGGGGSNSQAPVLSQTPTPPAPPDLSTNNPDADTTTQVVPSYDELKDEFEGYYEYQNQWGLNMVNASSAYARGGTGSGVTIGITDSGLDDTHFEISAPEGEGRGGDDE